MFKKYLFLLSLIGAPNISFALGVFCDHGISSLCTGDDLDRALTTIGDELDNSRKEGDIKTLSDANTYSDKGDSKTLNDAKAYSDQGANQTLNNAKAYSDQGDSKTLNDAQSYSNNLVKGEVSARESGDDRTFQRSALYTNQQIAKSLAAANNNYQQIERKVNRLEKKVNSSIAAVTAIASIPYVAENSFSFGIGTGNFSNSNAIAVGSQYKPSPNTDVRVNFSWDSSGNVISGAGFAAGW